MADVKANSAVQSPVFLRRVDELSRSSDMVWLASMIIGLGCTVFTSILWPFSPAGKFTVYLIILIRIALYMWGGEALKGKGGEVLGGMFKIGVVAGMFELLVDWGLIHWITNGRLIYLSGNDVVLLGSPVWMPFAWATVIADLGYLVLRIFGALKKSMSSQASYFTGSIIIGALAGPMIAVYEYFAYMCGWWKYEPANAMLGDYCALFIPAGEIIMFFFLLPIISRVFSREELKSDAFISAGVKFACCIAVGYTISYLLLEFGRAV